MVEAADARRPGITNCWGCGHRIETVPELFRCVDCRAPMHRDCLRDHFGSSMHLQPDGCALVEVLGDPALANVIAAALVRAAVKRSIPPVKDRADG